MKLSREYRVYLALWRKALKQLPEPLRINAGSTSLAISMRQGMYRAIKPFRDGALIDPELIEASEKLVVYLDKEAGALEFRERKALAALEGLLDELGIDEADLASPEDKIANQMLEDLFEETSKPRTTPFYTRED